MYLNDGLVSMEEECEVKGVDSFDDLDQIHQVLFVGVFVVEGDGEGEVGGLLLEGGEMVGDFVEFVLVIVEWQDDMSEEIVQCVLPSIYGLTFPAATRTYPAYMAENTNAQKVDIYFQQYIMKQQTNHTLTIEPTFHYFYKNEATILDSQYNVDGNLLAISNSNGEIMIYTASTDNEKKQQLRKVKIEHPSKKNSPILKLAWSYHQPNLLASCSIDHEILFDMVEETKLTNISSINTQTIPTFITFYPGSQIILSVGFSDGKLSLYGERFALIQEKKQAHEESINFLNWERKIQNNHPNTWIKTYFSEHSKEEREENPLMVSCSSDCYIKVWRYEGSRLEEICSQKAHDKQIRQVQWKPLQTQKIIVSCSEDGSVKFWALVNRKLQPKNIIKVQSPVYRAEYNLMGDLIAISYYNSKQQRVETKIMNDRLQPKINLSH